MAFATVPQLETHLRRSLTGPESAWATQALDIATAAIQTWTRQTLSMATSTDLLAGTYGRDLELPERPAGAVTEVKVNGTILPTDAWESNSRSLLRRGSYRLDDGWGDAVNHWGGPASTISVTYPHGFADGSPEMTVIRGVNLDMVSLALSVPSGVLAVSAESVGSYSVTYADAPSTGSIGLTDEHKNLLRRFRRTWGP